MNARTLLIYSVYISLVIQIVTGVITFNGVFIELPKGDRMLTDVITLESVVQFIEAAFYFYISLALTDINLENVTPRRYFDWVITTPTMLLSTIMYMDYENRKDDGQEGIRLKEFAVDNKDNIIKIFVYNFLMLVFGYLGETGMMDKWWSIFIGFVFFGLTFHNIYTNYVSRAGVTPNQNNNVLFNFLIVIWGLYGVAAVLPVLPKNLGYNVLDIIAKNFYGLFIYYKIKQVAAHMN